MRLIFLSDTHGKHNEIKIPDGDFLIFGGDMCSRGTIPEIEKFSQFLKDLPHKHKIVIAGNHDFPFEDERKNEAESLIKSTGGEYLNDSGTEIEGIKIWGSPVQPWFYDWAFNRQRGAEIKKHWDLIPPNIDVLITHGPPFGILDKVKSGESVGCEELLKTINEIKPKIHAFGHIHEAFGEVVQDGIHFINASNLDFHYQYKNCPVVCDL